MQGYFLLDRTSIQVRADLASAGQKARRFIPFCFRVCMFMAQPV